MKTLVTIFLVLFAITAIAQCGQSITDTRNGKIYPTVQIGMQCWMAKNLNVGYMEAGNVPASNNKNLKGTQVFEKYCYGNMDSVCNIYGGLYQWDEAMQYSLVPGAQGICMTGWHVPTYEEYYVMLDFLGGIAVAGEKMKAISPLWKISGYKATNSSGFTALPGGIRWDNSAFYNLGLDFNMWLSSMPPPDSRNPSQPAYSGGCSWGQESATNTQFYKNEGLSVRCIKN